MNPLTVENMTPPTGRVTTPIAEQSFEERAHLFAELSAMAYLPLAGATLWTKTMGFTQIVQIAFKNDLSVTIASTPSDIIMAFRGVQTADNIEEALRVDGELDGNLVGKAHTGFLNSFNLVWPLIAPILDSTKKVWACGHSLGGAMAAIAAVRASRRAGPNLDGCFTYGQPRIGDKTYLSALSGDYYRWVNHLDPVPRLPTKWLGYAHAGKEFYISRNGKVKNSNPIIRILTFLGGILNYARLALADHDIISYRNLLDVANQERANG